MVNHEERHDWPRSCRDGFSKKCYGLEQGWKNKRRSHTERTRALWNTRRETQIQTKLDHPTWKNGQHQTPETRPQLQTSRKKRSWTPQETMEMRRCENSSNDLNHGGRWWMLIDFHVKYPLIFSYFRKILRYKISWKSVRWEPSCSMRIDGRTDVTKHIVAFCNSANALETTFNHRLWKLRTVWICKLGKKKKEEKSADWKPEANFWLRFSAR